MSEETTTRDCEHFPHVLNCIRPSDHQVFSVCLACGDTGVPQERSDQGFGNIKWEGKPFPRGYPEWRTQEIRHEAAIAQALQQGRAQGLRELQPYWRHLDECKVTASERIGLMDAALPRCDCGLHDAINRLNSRAQAIQRRAEETGA